MTTDALRRTNPPPEKPRLGAFIAMALELGILFTFFAHSSLFGLLLCGGYAWFSATWSVLSSPKDRP